MCNFEVYLAQGKQCFSGLYEEPLGNSNNMQKFVREQILKARSVYRKTFFDNGKCQVEDWLVLNLTYSMFLKDSQKVFIEMHILLTPIDDHKTVFGEQPPIIGQRKFITKITNRDTKKSKSAPSKDKLCQVCQYIGEKVQFENAYDNKYDIRKGIMNCNTGLFRLQILLQFLF